MLWCCWLIWKGSWELSKNNLHNLAAISGIPVAAMYGSGLVAAALMALILIGNLWRSLRGDIREEAVSADIQYSVSHEQKTQGSAK
jgi:TRAP-type C4-dicarboxylate transport system permease small subunit